MKPDQCLSTSSEPSRGQRRPLRAGFTRRGFAASAAAAAAGLAWGPGVPFARAQARPTLDLSALPNFCSHEHWGSIDSIGRVPEGFRADVERGATPTTKTGLFDLLLDPYFRGWLKAAGSDPDQIAERAGAPDFAQLAAQSPQDALAALRPALRQQQFNGTYQTIRRGILTLYRADISHLDQAALSQLQAAIAESYERPFDWYQAAMKTAHFTELVRPVHPEFYVREQSSQTAAAESSFTRTVMRVDPLLELWTKKNPRRDGLAGITGVDPTDAASWRQFLAKLFDLAAENGALGIKQLQAYRRPLEYAQVEDAQVIWAGDLEPGQVRVFQDWVMHECCRLADARGWVHQVHVGTHNLTESSPMPLRSLAQRYGRMKIVMIHCWPFLEEAGWLAKHLPNIAIDTCWQPILNPQFFRDALNLWLNYVPTHKITCGHDATSVEMAVGSSLFTREILAEVLVERSAGLGLSEQDLLQAAADMLQNNSVALFGVGKRASV